MEIKTKGVLLYFIAFSATIFTFLGIFGIIPFALFKIISGYLLYSFFGLILSIGLIQNFINPSNRFPKRIVEVVENIFSAFLTASFLFTFFWEFPEGLRTLYFLTGYSFLAWIVVKINQRRRNNTLRKNFKEWITSLLWTLFATFFASSLIGFIADPPKEITFNFILLGIVFLFIYILNKFKK